MNCFNEGNDNNLDKENVCEKAGTAENKTEITRSQSAGSDFSEETENSHEEKSRRLYDNLMQESFDEIENMSEQIRRSSEISNIPVNPLAENFRKSFWGLEENQPKKKKKKKLKLLSFAVGVCIPFAIGFIVCGTIVWGKGFITSKLTDKKLINFTLPVAETPSLENEYYDENGQYTAMGVAKSMLSSVVTIEIFKDSDMFSGSSQGSGIIISEDGYIVTNAHVVEGEKIKKIKVILDNKDAYAAEIVGSDKASDIAVIKIQAKGLTVASFADSDKVQLGQEIVTIGSPAGFTSSITKGIISGLDRRIAPDEGFVPMKCFQLDAAINPGNSGGALFNMYGQVIGITSSKLKSSSYENIGFAITSNSAKPIIEELISKGYKEPAPRIGIGFYSVDEVMAEDGGIPVGIYITSVDENCDVYNSGIKESDILTEVNGMAVKDYDDLIEAIDGMKPGDICRGKGFHAGKDGKYEQDFKFEFKLMNPETSMVEKDKTTTDNN